MDFSASKAKGGDPETSTHCPYAKRESETMSRPVSGEGAAFLQELGPRQNREGCEGFKKAEGRTGCSKLCLFHLDVVGCGPACNPQPAVQRVGADGASGQAAGVAQEYLAGDPRLSRRGRTLGALFIITQASSWELEGALVYSSLGQTDQRCPFSLMNQDVEASVGGGGAPTLPSPVWGGGRGEEGGGWAGSSSAL